MLKHYKVNSQISVPQVRLIGADGKQIGVLAHDEALDYALGQGADLVLVTETAQPPVAKVIDYKKFLYQEAKKGREARKGQKGTGIKEVRVGSPFVAPGTVTIAINKTRQFLAKGYSIKVAVKFTGRQMGKQIFGHKIFARIKEELKEEGRVEREPKMEGKFLVMTIVPK